MIEYTKLDIVIAAFLLYEGTIGYIKGIRRSMFDMVKIFGTLVLTWLADKYLYSMVENEKWFNGLTSAIQGFVTGIFGKKFPLSFFFEYKKISFYILSFMIIIIVLKLVIMGFGTSEVTILHRVAGMMFGFAKGLFYIFALILLLDPLIQSYGGEAAGDMLSQSILLKYMYKYNILLDLVKM